MGSASLYVVPVPARAGRHRGGPVGLVVMCEAAGSVVFRPGGAAHGESLIVADDGPQMAP